MEENKEEVEVTEEIKKEENNISIKEIIDYVIIFSILVILVIVMLSLGIDMIYRRLVYMFMSLSFGSFQVKMYLKNKSLISLFLVITWLLLCILLIVSFFLEIYVPNEVLVN